MVYRDQKESDDLLDKLVASTRSPHGQFTAEKSWPLLQKRIQGGFGWYLWNHRVLLWRRLFFCVWLDGVSMNM